MPMPERGAVQMLPEQLPAIKKADINGDGFFRPDPVELERNQEFQELYARMDQEI